MMQQPMWAPASTDGTFLDMRDYARVVARYFVWVWGRGAPHGETVELTAEGDNADEVLDALVANLQTDPEA